MSTEGPRPGGFLISEAQGNQSRDQVTVVALNDGVTIHKPGRLLGKITKSVAAPVAAAGAGNTGNGAMGAIVASAGTKLGVYTLQCFAVAANAGKFRLEDPDGVFVGVVTVAVAFAGGGLAFTLADGATDFVAGDSFTITVAAGSGNWVAWDPTLFNGAENVAGIAWDYIDVSGANNVIAAAITRRAEVAKQLLDFGAAGAGQITAAIAQLASLGITVREAA